MAICVGGVPVRNEAQHISVAVQAVLAQQYQGDLDICIAVAPSDDATENLVKELVESHSNVFSVENPVGVTPAGLNAAISASSGEVVVRVDGHVRLCDGYITTAVATMARTGAVNVGGRQLAVGTTGFEKAVAAVMMSVVGSGGAEYRVGEEEKSVDTVFLACLTERPVTKLAGLMKLLSEIRITSSTSGFARQAEPFGLTRRSLLSTNPGRHCERLPVNISITGAIRLRLCGCMARL